MCDLCNIDSDIIILIIKNHNDDNDNDTIVTQELSIFCSFCPWLWRLARKTLGGLIPIEKIRSVVVTSHLW